MINPFLLLPLYSYPSGSSWDGVYSQVAANPNLLFSVIINPNSGPESSPPEAAWITAVSKLNSYNNTQLLGYVHVESCSRPAAEVTADIDTYASWASYGSADIHLDGIFFDEAPNDATTDTVSYMVNVTGHARSALPVKGSAPYVMLNPGTAVSDSFYDTADSIVALEDSYSAYSQNAINAVESTQRAKSAFILYSFTAGSTGQSSVVSSLLNGDIPGVYITDSAGYMELSSLFSQLASSLAQAAPLVGSSASSAAASTAPTTSTTPSSESGSPPESPTSSIPDYSSTPATSISSSPPAAATTLVTSILPAVTSAAATSTHTYHHHSFRPTGSSQTESRSPDAEDDECDGDKQ